MIHAFITDKLLIFYLQVKERQAAIEAAALRATSHMEKPATENMSVVAPVQDSKIASDNKKPKREKEYKLHLPSTSASSVSRLPMFSSKSTPSTPVAAKSSAVHEDKENMTASSAVTPVKKVKKTHTPSPAPTSAVLKTTTPQFQSGTEPAGASAEPSSLVMATVDAKPEAASEVDDLTKKMKTVLKGVFLVQQHKHCNSATTQTD